MYLYIITCDETDIYVNYLTVAWKQLSLNEYFGVFNILLQHVIDTEPVNSNVYHQKLINGLKSVISFAESTRAFNLKSTNLENELKRINQSTCGELRRSGTRVTKYGT